MLQLTKWDNRPDCLRVMAYEWCSEICRNSPDLDDGRHLLFPALEIGFRGLDSRHQWTNVRPVHTEYHQRMADIVFKSESEEVIADLLQARTTQNYPKKSRGLLDTWARHLIHLEHVASASQRLWRLVVHSIEHLGFHSFDRVGVEGFAALLDRLEIDVNNVDSRNRWLQLLLEVVQSPKGRQSLSHSYWELITELAVAGAWLLCGPIDYELQVMVSLEADQEWDRLECWMGFVWLLRRPKIGAVPEGLERVMLSLLRQRPGVAQRLEQWLQRSAIDDAPKCLEFLRWICEQAGLGLTPQQDTP